TSEVAVAVTADGSWSLSLDMSSLQDGAITLSVSGTNNLGAVATTVTDSSVSMSRLKPTLTGATFNPTHQAIGQSVEVTLTFDSEMESATATLGGQPISTLAATADRTIWRGSVVVPSSVERSVALVVSDYQDAVGNVGDDNSTQALAITPTLSIGAINGGKTINTTDASAVAISGSSTRFEDGETLSVVASDSVGGKTSEVAVAVTADGSWSLSLDMSSLQDGAITLSVSGTNNLGAVATTVTDSSVSMSRLKPTLTGATFNPTHQAIGESVEVTLTFDSEMESATATLGGQPISTLAATADRTIWRGSVVVPSSVERSVALVVSDYQDAVGNVGDDNSTQALAITPTLS
ncbi:tandem large repeat, partial [Vibrio cionasavignyae]